MKWLVSALILLAAGAAAGLGLLVYAMYVVVGLAILGVGLSRYWSGSLQVDRNTLPSNLVRGEQVQVRVTLRLQGRLPMPWAIAEDALPLADLSAIPPRLRADGARVRLLSLSRHELGEIEYELEFLERGYFQVGPVLIETGDVFGLDRRYRVAGAPQLVAVLPDIVPLGAYDVASRRAGGEIRLTHRLFEDPTRIQGVRPYENGDPLSRVHWRASARTGILQCKTFEPSCVAGATLLLDFHEESFTGPGRIARRELAVVTVASLAFALAEGGQQLGFATNGHDAADRVRREGWALEFHTRRQAQERTAMRASSDRLRPLQIQTGRNPGLPHDIRTLLARLEPGQGLRFAELIREVQSRLPRDATVLAVLGEADMSTALALGQLRRQGYAVTAIVVVFDEPDCSEWAQPPDWMAHLMAERIPFRRLATREDLARLGDYSTAAPRGATR